MVCVFKQPFSVFKQHFTHFNTLFHSHVLSQIFLNNNFQFLNTHTKRALSVGDLLIWKRLVDNFDAFSLAVTFSSNFIGDLLSLGTVIYKAWSIFLVMPASIYIYIYVYILRIMLMSVLKLLVNNPIKESFYRKRKKKKN